MTKKASSVLMNANRVTKIEGSLKRGRQKYCAIGLLLHQLGNNKDAREALNRDDTQLGISIVSKHYKVPRGVLTKLVHKNDAEKSKLLKDALITLPELGEWLYSKGY